jgi:hypothetical protein
VADGSWTAAGTADGHAGVVGGDATLARARLLRQVASCAHRIGLRPVCRDAVRGGVCSAPRPSVIAARACARRPTGLSRSAAWPNSSTGTTGDARIRRSAGKHRTRPISARSHRLRQRRRNAMADGSCECVDSRLRRYPPDRAIAVPYGQAGEKPCVSLTLPTGRRLPTSFTVPPHQQGLILIPGKVKPSTGYEP